MANYIKEASVNIHNGLLTETIKFTPGLNIISGENGTCKTKLLQSLKTGTVIFFDQNLGCARQAISPKRNAQRHAVDQIYNSLRQSGTNLDGIINERDMNDTAFSNYPSLGELFYAVYENTCKDGGAQIEKMNETTSEFNTIIQRVFSNYNLNATWNADNGRPQIELIKNGTVTVPLEGLSLGEQEILSLVMNIYSSRNRYDVFLIDEPEVHLNWHLEEKLFEFFNYYCETYSKQIIVVTHSRAIFKPEFYNKSQFLYWNSEGNISIAKEINREQRKRIAGEAIDILRLGDFKKPTIFVEDNAHLLVLEKISSAMSVEVSIIKCGTKSNLRSLFNLSLKEGNWKNSLFIEDGDNEGYTILDDNFLHLDKYCIENYLLDIPIITNMTKKSENEIRAIIFSSITANKSKILKKNKFFEFLFEQIKVEDITPERLAKIDASEIFNDFLSKLDMNAKNYISSYIDVTASRNELNKIFPKQLVSWMVKNQSAG